MVKSPAPLAKYQDALINSEGISAAITERQRYGGKHRKKDTYSKNVRRDKTRSMENQREAEAYISFQQKREEKKLKELHE